ncbi:MAG: glycosyltransferase [Methylorubrum populi]
MGYAERDAFLDAIDCLVVPPIRPEPFGRTVAEAYGRGVPVIGTEVGGIGEQVGPGAWLVPPRRRPGPRRRDGAGRGRARPSRRGARPGRFRPGRDRRVENAFCAGLLASLAVLMLAASGAPLERFGLAVPTDGIDAELKLFVEDKQGGLWASGNETGHVFALGGAAALLLSLRYRLKAIYLVYFAAVLASFPLTNNRSGLLVPLLFLVLLMRRRLRAGPVLAALGAVGALLVVSSLTGEIPLPETLTQAVEKRFAEDNRVSGNFDERFLSGVTALRLVAEHPFGVGEIARRDALRAMTGLVTPHNGFISLALQSGVAAALLLVAGLLRILAAPAAFGPFVTYSAVFMVPSLMFEELSVNQYFLFFMAVVLASLAVTDPSRRREA